MKLINKLFNLMQWYFWQTGVNFAYEMPRAKSFVPISFPLYAEAYRQKFIIQLGINTYMQNIYPKEVQIWQIDIFVLFFYY